MRCGAADNGAQADDRVILPAFLPFLMRSAESQSAGNPRDLDIASFTSSRLSASNAPDSNLDTKNSLNLDATMPTLMSLERFPSYTFILIISF
jgi:hypothetical protein